MKKDKKEQALIKIKRESFWSKIIKFFRKSKQGNNISIQTNNTESKIDTQKEEFIEYVTKIQNEETQLINLQKRYREGEIKEEDLTEEQVKKLCDLYDKQIENLRKSNSIRKENILKFI